MMKIRNFLVFGVIALLFFSLSIDFVAAQDGTPGGIDDPNDQEAKNGHQDPPKGVDEKRRDFERRKLDIDKSNNNAVITTSWAEEKVNDEVELDFDLQDDSPTLNIEYDLNKDSKTMRLSFQLIFQKLFEFQDSNNNGRYDEGENIISEYVFRGSDFEDIEFTEEENSYKFHAQTVDSVFKIDVTGGGKFMDMNGSTLNPYESKIDFTINYDFESNDSMLGLKMGLKSDHPKEMGKHTFDEENQWAEDESWLQLKNDNYSGFFSWQNRAQGNGKDIPVNATFISESAVDEFGSVQAVDDVLYLSYPRSSEIVHDPKVGVVGESSLSYSIDEGLDMMSMFIILIVSMIAAALVFSSGIYMRKKD